MSAETMTPEDVERYERMIAERVEKYGVTRAEAERASMAFWSDGSDDNRLAYDAGARTLEDFIRFFKGKGLLGYTFSFCNVCQRATRSDEAGRCIDEGHGRAFARQQGGL